MIQSLACMSLLFETPGRRIEITQYVVPRYFQSVLLYSRKLKRIPEKIPFGAEISLAVAMGIISSVYYSDSEAVKKSFNWVVKLVAGGEGEESWREKKEWKKHKIVKGGKRLFLKKEG